ncbi:pantoate--beta-alanine ligase [Paludibacter sp.]|uniref:pantoate--beta-alanine ligase n=1 Tax=Paludibacter sp. TaxID=1898105 RepID=UPI001354CE03|nr:pantoate--beta-alanine ligase [Paludibacter sp.]MTK53773.1 pantoate--beta-alanine ligase [Paludibacter sp.]
MKVFSTIADLKAEIAAQKAAGKTIGLVPTMGALHAGHASLVKKCAAENDVTVVSVFVNPTQFNDKNDLKNYPRTLEKDTELLQSVGCNLIFAPSEDEIYPEPDTRVFDFTPLDKVMEGKYRPGHFNGVAQIVSKLFDIVTPDRAYFGEKDFQQLAIIREMVKQLGLALEIIACPIVREADGLALSSRNARLTDSQRKKAVTISKVLFESRNFAPSKPIAELTDWVIDNVNKESELRVEYFEIVDGNTLQAVSDWNQTDYIVGCITVFCGEVRLIDNIRYK